MVYILYLDASGDPGQYRGKNTKYFVLGGIACKPEVSFECSKKLNTLLEKYFPDPTIRPKKVHSHSLRTNRYPWNQIDGQKFADELFNLITSSDITIFSMIIDKEAHWKQYVSPIEPYNLTLEMMMGRYEWFLERNKDIGIVVSDRENSALMDSLIILFERFKEKGTEFKKLKAIIDTIFFAPSYTCPVLQTVDFCSYAVFSKYEYNNLNRYNQIKTKFDPYGEYKLPR